MKPVKMTGIFNHDKEIQVERIYQGEKGFQIITPFYTHIDKSGKPAGILVNRGWIPYDFNDQRKHLTVNAGSVSGVLYRGDAKHKYSVPNSPTIQDYRNVTPHDFACVDQLPNWEEAGKFMLHQIDFDADNRQILPTVPTTAEMAHFCNSAERHGSYANMWRMLTWVGVVGNAAMWLYL